MPDPSEIPVSHVVNMRNQGMSNNQIIQNLQRYGYSLDQINNAVNQADIKVGIYKQGSSSSSFSSQQSQQFQQSPPPQMPPMQMSRPGLQEEQGSSGQGGEDEIPEEVSEHDERIHEVAEAIIEEKWAELMDSVNRIIEWKDHIESRVSKTEQQIADLTANFNRLHEGVLGKIGEYDKGLSNVTTEIKALEKVFQKILPGFVENVHELSRITETMRKEK